MAASLIIRGVGKCYPGKDGTPPLTVLENVDFTVPEGSIVALVGLNGSGKTTLLRIIAGLEPPSHGAVEVRYSGESPATGHDIGMVFQELGLLPWRSARENIEIGLECLRRPAEERRAVALKFLEIFGLAEYENTYPKALSGGMRQKLAIARTLAPCPGVVLMDEPFSALDCETRNKLHAFLLDVWSQRRDTILFATHNIEEAVFLSDQIVVISPKPSRVVERIPVTIPRPRDRTDPTSNTIRRHVLHLLRDVSSGKKG